MNLNSPRSKRAVILLLSATAIGAAAWVGLDRNAARLSGAQQAGLTPAATPDQPKPPAAVTPSAGQETAVEAASVTQPQQSAATDAADAQAPAFDEVRREADGMTVIAGRAEPGADISVLLDGQEISTVAADASGKFAAIAIIAPDGEGHILSLSQSGRSSDGQIILAPLAALPLMTADAVPQADTQRVASLQTTTVQDALPLDADADGSASEAASAVQTDEAQEVEAETPQATQTPQVQAESAPDATEPDAPQQVAVLSATEEGVELLNVPPPEVMSNVALDTISYSNAGNVQLSGRAQSQATAVRVYLNNNAVVSLKVDDRGRWRGDLPDVDEGIYTLRVDEVSADGAVTSRVETPFKRESREALANASQGQGGLLRKVTVQKGTTLWAIAEQRYGSGLLYVDVVKANESAIRDPDLIYPGQVFDLPEGAAQP